MTLTSDFINELKKEGYYYNINETDNGDIVVLYDYQFTTAILIDVNQWGYGERYCFKTRAEAKHQLNRYLNNEEITGYIRKL